MSMPLEKIELHTILYPLVDRMLLLLCVQLAHTSRRRADWDEEGEKGADWDVEEEQPDLKPNYNFWQVFNVVLKIQEHRDCWNHQKQPDESNSIAEIDGTITIDSSSNCSDGWHTDLVRALESLEDGRWLNDTAIDGYLKLLTERFERIAFLSTDIWKHFDKHKKVPKQKWCLTDVDMVLLPTIRNNNHWMMIVVDVRRKCLFVMDSFKSYGAEKNRIADIM